MYPSRNSWSLGTGSEYNGGFTRRRLGSVPSDTADVGFWLFRFVFLKLVDVAPTTRGIERRRLILINKWISLLCISVRKP